jgi:hypothetical protein
MSDIVTYLENNSMTQQIELLNEKDPVFIVGSPRSGTSLLSRIINSHPRIAIPYESQLYNTFYPWLKYYGDLQQEKIRYRLVRDILQTASLKFWTPVPEIDETLHAIVRYNFHGVVDALISTWAKGHGKERWGEKSPRHIFYWKEILEGFPNAKFIHIVRDGRDASLSWKNSRMGPKHFYSLAKRWVDYLEHVDELRCNIPANQFFELRYEDLLSDSEKNVRNICVFLEEEEYPDDMLAFYKDKIDYPTDRQNRINLMKPLLKENSEKWKRLLSENDQRIIEAVAGSKLKSYGYPLIFNRPVLTSLEKIIYKYIEHPPRRFWSMLMNHQGHKESLGLLLIYLRLRLGL